MIDWIKKNYKVLAILTPIIIFFVGKAYNVITTISELKINQNSMKDQILDINTRVKFLERLKMASTSDFNGKIDPSNLVNNSLSLSTEQFNDTLNIIRNESPKEAMTSLEKKSYFTKEQLPSIFSPAPQNLDSIVK